MGRARTSYRKRPLGVFDRVVNGAVVYQKIYHVTAETTERAEPTGFSRYVAEPFRKRIPDHRQQA